MISTDPNTRQQPSRRSLRKPGYDYRQAGVYFVTMCTHQKAKLFGQIIDGEMQLNELGEVVRVEWQRIEQLRTNVQLDLFVLMPNHIHGLIIIADTQNQENMPPNEVLDASRATTIHKGSLGAIVGQFKAAVSRQARSEAIEGRGRIWQRNYHDRIVGNEESLNRIRRYIVENPAQWVEDSLYVE